jgi:hypothetical protein
MKYIGALLTAAFLLIAVRAYACNECNTTIWELHLNGFVVSFGDMDQEQCEALKAEIESQTEPFTELVCVEVPAAREQI